MEKIASFQVDHTKLNPGMYLSRIDQGVVTYDIRFCKPNGGVYLENAGMHTLEHLFATYARNSEYKDHVIYVGPMGCRTGFYLLTLGLSHQDAIRLVQQSMAFISAYEGEIPGATEVECGNYREQDLSGARRYAASMLQVLEGYTVKQLEYRR